MKNNWKGNVQAHEDPFKIFNITKITLILVLVFSLQLRAEVFSQNKLTIEMHDVSVEQVFAEIQKQSNYAFTYPSEMIKNLKKVNVNISNGDLESILDICLKNSGMTYKIVDSHVVIRPEKQKSSVPQQERTIIRGSVKDENGESLPGVSILVEGTTTGAATNSDGVFVIVSPKGEKTVLVFSFIGFETQKIEVKGRPYVNITLAEKISKIDEVVVSGLGFSWNKRTFSGVATEITKEDIEMINPTDIFQVLDILDPAFEKIEDELMGSDPNSVPELRIRGSNSLPNLKNDYEGDPSAPLFMVNGFESTLEYVMDIPPAEIESITLLKDAAATALYGSNAANGIVVIELIKPKSGRLHVNYGIRSVIKTPILSDYSLLDAQQKLNMEALRGYENRLSDSYNSKQAAISSGVNTNWLDAPTRVGTDINHSFGIGGGSEDFTYSVSLNANPNEGVMKGSSRDVYAGSVSISYRANNLVFSNDLSYSNSTGNNSMAGTFSEYATMNPYYTPFDENGDYKFYLSVKDDKNNDVINPLWNTTIGAYDVTESTSMRENFRVRWQIIENLSLNGTISYSSTKGKSEVFKPANHTDFRAVPSPLEKGSFTLSNSESENVNARLGLSYLKMIKDHSLNFNCNSSFNSVRRESNGYSSIGFPSKELSHPEFAVSYATGRPTGNSSVVRSAGFMSSVNYSYKYKYFADFSYTADISSQFGSSNKWANFWSIGAGYNLDREDFIKKLKHIKKLKIRGSIGNTGSTAFGAYQALQVYEYNTESYYAGYGVGVDLKGIGNPNLAWQEVVKRNIGIDGSVFKGKFSFSFDYYNDETKDAITQQSLPSYLGFSSYSVNLGGIINQGYDFAVSSNIIRTKDLFVSLSIRANNNKEELTDIGDAYDNFNAAQLATNKTSPIKLIYEGQPTTVFYVAESIGIDPSTGKEIFLTEDGDQTFIYDEAKKISFNQRPDLRGSFGVTSRYKGITLSCNFAFGIGGQNFNSTLLSKVENIGNAAINVDSRAFSDRWMKQGDVSLYKNVADVSTTYASSRFLQNASFVELGNLSLAYEFQPDFVKETLHLRSLNLSMGTNKLFRISSIREERGLAYPFARTYNISLRTSF